MNDTRQRLLYAALAELFSYPRETLVDAARQARALAASEPVERRADAGARPGATAALARFCAHVETTPLEALQELYTTTFDLQPACAPYFGHQLLGESPLRGPLLAKLSELYAAESFTPREELADHVAEVLRFLSVAREARAHGDLVEDGLVPALRRMIEAIPDGANPYRDVLVAAEALAAAQVPLADAVPTRTREVRP